MLDLFARTIRGIEWVAAAEIERRCAATIIQIRHREVRFQIPTLSSNLLDAGSVDDIFLTVAILDDLDHTRATLSTLKKKANGIDFAEAIEPLGQIRKIPKQPNFDVVASFLGRRNYNRYELEDTLAEVIKERTRWRYAAQRSDTSLPLDLSFRIHLSGNESIVGVRLTMTPLHRRIYKTSSRPGTLHPPLAYAMTMLSSLTEKHRLLDPFCGVGTIPIEALRLEPEASSSGVDIDPDSIRKAAINARAANLPVDFVLGDAGQLPFSDRLIDRVISNPPWGRAVGLQGKLRSGTSPFFEEIRRVSKLDARIVLLIDPQADTEATIELCGLKSLIRVPVSLFGTWPEIFLLAEASSETIPPFDDGFIYGPALNKYWEQWPSLSEKSSGQSK